MPDGARAAHGGVYADMQPAKGNGGSVMNHPETLHRLARDRQAAFIEEARRERLVRDLSSTKDDQPRERFSVRKLRWILFRPIGA